ncbi:hypothetical protein ANCCEY_08047 [Ancylostoma ceylanicum]|uniref:Amiloride-sensitive sodium channel n=1 Tax=Ancylostoma ceylanicum TaxID=53326 RepID=A0A0D6LNU8_9BILA|nr:hypothetical protein ANCCEY_08047 [Ancylostoma ceylanicum]
MSFKKVFSILVLLFLIISCTVLFILQSLYFIFRTAASTEKELIKSVDGSPLTIPALVICNRMPFSQDGVNSVNANLRQDPAMRYLLEWTNPSLKEDADYVAMSQSYMNQGQTILFQYLSQNIRNHSINQMEYACQSVINSCSYQMSRNSWYSQQTTPLHPGVDIFLRENADDVIALVNQLENPIRLLDKKGIRLRMRKEKKADTRRSHCGQTLGEAVSADKNALQNNRTNFLICTIMVCPMFNRFSVLRFPFWICFPEGFDPVLRVPSITCRDDPT